MSIHTRVLPGGVRLIVVTLMAIALMTLTGCVPTGQPRGADAGATGAKASLADSAAPIDAVHIGEKACLECHEHAGTHFSNTLHANVFRSNPRGQQQAQVCESCHGPGSRHAEDTANKRLIVGFTRHWETPVQVQNAQCLACHQGGQRLHWVGSTHDTNKVACSDCHNPMTRNSLNGLTSKDSIVETCYSCHPKQRAEFLKRSHMPLSEGKMSCLDCHNPHGSATRPLLKADSVNEVCYACHAEKRGPYLWEHAPVRENCSNCHTPHGSNHDKLLVAARPFLCQQCHNPSVGHPGQFFNASQTAANANPLRAGAPVPSQRIIGRACQNCHSQIHGSNHPSGTRWQR